MDNININNTIATVDPVTLADKSILITSEQTAQPQEEDNSAAKTATLGKFKDSHELLSAYNNLEKEFTKRSQKLKCLEAEVNKTKANQDSAVKEIMGRMIEINPELGEIISAAEHEVPCGADTTSSIEAKVALALKGKILPKDLEARQSYVDKIIESDSLLKAKILSNALDKLPSLATPKLNKYRGQTIITPPNRPHNIAEAGKLAENIMNNRSR